MNVDTLAVEGKLAKDTGYRNIFPAAMCNGTKGNTLQNGSPEELCSVVEFPRPVASLLKWQFWLIHDMQSVVGHCLLGALVLLVSLVSVLTE